MAGMGTLVKYNAKKKRPDGLETYYLYMSLGKDSTTQKGYKQKPFKILAKNEREAKKKRIEIVASITQDWTDADRITVREFLTKWMTDYVKGKPLKIKTQIDYQMVIDNYLNPIIDLKLPQVTPIRLNELYSKIKKETSSFAAAKTHRVLSSAFGKAVQWGILKDNPATSADGPTQEKPEQKVLTSDMIYKFLESMKSFTPGKRITNTERDYLICWMAIETGIREGELFGLRWTDINFDNNIVSVRQKLTTPGYNPVFEKVKTKKSDRPILISDELKEALKNKKAKQNELRLKLGEKWNSKFNLVFCNECGKPFGHPIDMCKFSGRNFKRLLKLAELPTDIKFHGLRHTFATILLESGIHPKIVQEMLGHSSIGITLDTYSHVVPTMQKEAVQAMRQKITRRTAQKE